jgi:hypothetical protein
MEIPTATATSTNIKLPTAPVILIKENDKFSEMILPIATEIPLAIPSRISVEDYIRLISYAIELTPREKVQERFPYISPVISYAEEKGFILRYLDSNFDSGFHSNSESEFKIEFFLREQRLMPHFSFHFREYNTIVGSKHFPFFKQKRCCSVTYRINKNEHLIRKLLNFDDTCLINNYTFVFLDIECKVGSNDFFRTFIPFVFKLISITARIDDIIAAEYPNGIDHSISEILIQHYAISPLPPNLLRLLSNNESTS